MQKPVNGSDTKPTTGPNRHNRRTTAHIDENPDELPTVEVVRETVKQQKHFRPSRSRHSQLKELTRIKDFDSFPLADFAPNATLHPSIQQQFHQISPQCSNEFPVKIKYSETFTNETDVVIGIDFGTATTKSCLKRCRDSSVCCSVFQWHRKRLPDLICNQL